MGSTVSVVQLCTNALSLLGEQEILSLTDNTKRANLCNNHLPMARDAALEKMKPNFAKEYRSLSQLATAPAFKWDFGYQLPSDYITTVELRPKRTDYEIVGDRLFTDETEALLIYIRRVTDTTLWTPLFVETMEYKLAALIAPVLKSDQAIAARMDQLFRLTALQAQTSDAQEESTKPIEADDLIIVRTQV